MNTASQSIFDLQPRMALKHGQSVVISSVASQSGRITVCGNNCLQLITHLNDIEIKPTALFVI